MMITRLGGVAVVALAAALLPAARAHAASAPTAAFTWSPVSPVTGQQMTFDGSASTCPAHTTCTYKYVDLADGSTLGTARVSQFTFASAGIKQAQLTVRSSNGRSASAEHDVTVSQAGGGGGLLTWSPPACGGADGLTCTTISLSATGPQNPSLAANVDYKLIMPSTPITGGTLTISGGHNVQIIGGEIDLVNPCSDNASFCPTQANGAVYITDGNPGEVYLEGVWIHNTQPPGATCPGGGMSCSTADGIDVNVGDGGNPATPPLIVLQNLRIDGISGCSGGTDHADVFQPYNAGTATIDVDHLTGTSDCQGMQTDPDYGFAHFGTLPAYDIRNVNMDVLANPYTGDSNRYMWWLTFNTACNSGPVALANDYAQEPDGTLSINSVWPDTDQPAACKSVWSPPTLSFPASPQITGVLSEGLPPGGDYVPPGVAGTGYVSPGYQ